MPRLYGQRIMLREYRSGDFEHIREWVNDPEVVDNLSDIFLFAHTEQNTESFLQHVLHNNNRDECHFIIAFKDSGDYIGQIDLISLDWKNRKTEIGIVIGNEANRGKGYGAEAIRLIQDFVFNRLNMHRLEIKVRAYNSRAHNCYLKCGFKEEGRLRDNFFINGQYHDSIFLAMLRPDYQAANPSAQT